MYLYKITCIKFERVDCMETPTGANVPNPNEPAAFDSKSFSEADLDRTLKTAFDEVFFSESMTLSEETKASVTDASMVIMDEIAQASDDDGSALNDILAASKRMELESRLENDKSMFKCVNVIEELVSAKIDEQIKKMNICDCPKCRLDILAYSLNNIKPSYVVSDRGSLFSKLAYCEKQGYADMAMIVTQACVAVSSNPQH